MPIPLPNLDDKTFDGLVAEAQAALPALYPPWTDYNPSDPGITLIELFAWLVEMAIYRNNRITEASYRTFIKLLAGPDAAAALASQPLADAIRATVVGLRQTYRAATVQDYESLTLTQWPDSPEAAMLATALGANQPPQPMPAIQRVTCLGETNLGSSGAVQVGGTASFRAMATLSDGSTEDVTAVATWGSSAASVASVSAGAATGLGAGAAQITATLGAVSGQAALTVGTSTLVSVALTPTLPVVATGRIVRFVVTGTYADGSTADVTPSAAWSSSAASILTIDATGRAQAIAAGQSTVTATVTVTTQVGGVPHTTTVTGSTVVTVASAALASIAITPAVCSLSIGDRQQLVAVGHYTDGTVADLTASVAWSSGTPGVAFVSSSTGSTGLMTAVSGGMATLTATLGAASGTASVTVLSARLVSIAITRPSAAIPAGAKVALTAQGTYSDGSVADLTAKATWSSSAPVIASVSSSAASPGLVTAGSPGGPATVTASIGSGAGIVAGTASVTVTSATLASIAISPASPSLPVGATIPLTAQGTYSDGSRVDLTALVSWSTGSGSIASIAAGGAVTGAGAGQTAVHAALGTVTGSATLTVTSATLRTLAVTPASPLVLLGRSLPMKATGTYSDGSTFDLTTHVAWSTGAPAVATVSSASGTQGLCSATGVGTTSVSATLSSITGTTTVTVPSIVQIVVTPIRATRPGGERFQLSATAVFSNGSLQDVTQQASWTSSSAPVAAIVAPGLVSTGAPGSTTITATYTGISGSTTLTVGSVVVTALSLIPKGAPLRAPGHVSLVVAPNSGAGTAPWLTPSPALTSALKAFFDPRRLLTTHVHVTGPVYVPVTIAATLYLADDADAGAVKANAVAALVARFDPFRGGEDGAGWPFGRYLHVSEIYSVLSRQSGVHYLDGVVVSGGAPPSDSEHVVLAPHQLVRIESAGILLTLKERQANQWVQVSL